MALKRKKRRARKELSETLAQDASNPRHVKPTTKEALIVHNAGLVEQLFSSEPWTEIAFPLITESIASVSGRFTNGRFHHGSLTKHGMNRDELAGYQLALEEFHNRLHDFVRVRDELLARKKQEQIDSKQPIYNPFMEADNEET